jgi:hypothetical protein
MKEFTYNFGSFHEGKDFNYDFLLNDTAYSGGWLPAFR